MTSFRDRTPAWKALVAQKMVDGAYDRLLTPYVGHI
jgi:hypothetical protein